MLLVSGERGRAALEGLMRECGFSAVRAAGSGGEARRLFSEGGFECTRSGYLYQIVSD